MHVHSKSQFKRVPALDKCFAILGLLARSNQPLGISEICRELDLNKSTVFNMVHTLADIEVLELVDRGKYGFGTYLHLIANDAGRRADVIRTIRPFLKEIARASNFCAFLGVRSRLEAVILDKVEAAVDIKVAAEVGMRLPIFAGASGKALLSELSDSQLAQVLASVELPRFTPHSCVNEAEYREMILRVREDGIAFDREEYIEGIVAVAVPINTHRKGREAAIWAVALKRQGSEQEISELSELMKKIARDIDIRLQPNQAQ
jgi:IclR family transcriptional regulator, KDG regulon repressor